MRETVILDHTLKDMLAALHSDEYPCKHDCLAVKMDALIEAWSEYCKAREVEQWPQ